MPERRIIPHGGLRAWDGIHPVLDLVLRTTGVERPKVAFLAQAVGDCPDKLELLYGRIPAERAETSHLDLFNRTITDIRSYLLDQEVIVVSGGNTANLLAIWRVHGVDQILREAWEAGVVLTGGSAGSLCWFEGGTTDSFDLNRLHPLRDGLGFLPGSHCPHYDGEEQRRPLYQRLIGEGFPAGIAIDEDAAAVYHGTDLAEVVTARADATAYRVELVDGAVVETPLEARLLGEQG